MSDFTERAREMLAPYSMPDGVRAALYLQLCALLAREAAMREALALSLRALESCSPADYSTGHVIHPSYDAALCDRAEQAARAALASATGEAPAPRLSELRGMAQMPEGETAEALVDAARRWAGDPIKGIGLRSDTPAPQPPAEREAPASPTDAELETRTGEPHIDGWPLMSGLPRPREAREAPETVATMQWVPMYERAPDPGAECAVIVRYRADHPGFATIDTWDVQREDPTGMGWPTIETGYGWNDNHEADVIAWMKLPPHPPVEWDQRLSDDEAAAIRALPRQ